MDQVPDSPLTDGSVVVDGCDVSYEAGGSGPTVALLHGGSAHAGWWEGVAERLAPRFHVVVPELSGHGRSGHRPTYQPSLWAEEVEQVVAATGATRAIVVGHSMGGAVGSYVAARRPDLVTGLMLVDTLLPPRDAEALAAKSRPRPNSVYPTRDLILERFRLVPPGTVADTSTLEQIAERAIVLTSAGWTWRFDPAARYRVTAAGLRTHLELVKCAVAYVSGELSPHDGGAATAYLEEVLGRPVGHFQVSGSFHHVPLDDPGACATLIADFAIGCETRMSEESQDSGGPGSFGQTPK